MRVRWRVTTPLMIGADVGDMRWIPRFKGSRPFNPDGYGKRPGLFYVAGLAQAVVPLAYLADRFLDAVRPGVAVSGKHLISGDCIQACQRFDGLGGVRGERRDLGAARPRGHRVGGECVPDE